MFYSLFFNAEKLFIFQHFLSVIFFYYTKCIFCLISTFFIRPSVLISFFSYVNVNGTIIPWNDDMKMRKVVFFPIVVVDKYSREHRLVYLTSHILNRTRTSVGCKRNPFYKKCVKCKLKYTNCKQKKIISCFRNIF